MLKFTTVLTACALMGSCATKPAAPATPPSDVKLLRSGDGIEVAILTLGPQKDKALINVTGSRSVLDDVVLPYDIEVQGRDVRYLTQWRGRNFAFVQLASDSYGTAWQLYVPGQLLKPIRLTLARDVKISADDLQKKHALQKQSGEIEKFMKFDRAFEQSNSDGDIHKEVIEFQSACQTKADLKVDWQTFSDDVLKHMGVAAFCSYSIGAMQTMCRDSKVAQKAIQKKVRGVVCAHGDAQSMQLGKDGTLNWTVNVEGANSSDYVREFLGKSL